MYITYEELKLDLLNMELNNIKLSKEEYLFSILMLTSEGHLVTYEQIAVKLWGTNVYYNKSNIINVSFRVRKKWNLKRIHLLKVIC